MKTSTGFVKNILRTQEEDYHQFRRAFIIKNVPRWKRFLMDAFPITIKWFDYAIAENKEDKNKLTLLQRNKVKAKNF